MPQSEAIAATSDAPNGTLPRQRAVLFIVFLGIVSLFGDMTYEGARSITGPYLGALGVTATTTGIVAGFGEFVSVAAVARRNSFTRLLSGI
jgi:hypothetical protein